MTITLVCLREDVLMCGYIEYSVWYAVFSIGTNVTVCFGIL